MSPALLEALILLLGEAMRSGVQISHVLAEAKEKGQVSEETWAAILQDIDASEEIWRLAGDE
jgi:hypothetical protein